MSNSLISNAIYLDDVPKDEWRKSYIGPGYRSVSYKVDAMRQGQIILFGYDHAENPKTFIMPWNSHVKYAVKYETPEKDIYDRFVATKEFKNSFERKKWVEAAAGISIVECLRPEQEVLHFLFDDDVLQEGFNKQPLRLHYFDIETEISDSFEEPADARNRINMMTIYDTVTEKYYTWMLQHAEVDFKDEPLCHYPKDKFVIFEFNDDEPAMLEHFISWNEDNYPDCRISWNGKAYDEPYLVRRVENVLGKAAAQRLSPVGKYFIKDVNHDNKRTDVSAKIEVNIDGMFIADALVLYRDKFGISKPDGGFSLDNIGEVEGCGHKLHYDGTLKDLYLKDWQRFYEYNVRDVDLLKRIEEKCKMVPLARVITSFGLSSYSTIYSSISYLVGSIIAFSKTEMNRVMCSYVGEKRHFNGFEGAFVFPTQVGVKRHGTATIDFASLYPSVIQSLNASPETFIGKVLIQHLDPTGTPMPINESNDIYFDIFDDNVAKASNVGQLFIKYPNGKRTAIKLESLREWIKQHGIYSMNNTIFRRHEEKVGVVAKWCEYFYNQRKIAKAKMLAIFHELHNPENKFTDEEREIKEVQQENYNSRQGAMKNMINSVYGQMGSAYSPIANLDIAQSITRTGRFCNTNASMFILREFQKRYDPNFKGYHIKSYNRDKDPELYEKTPWMDVAAVGGDTDSQFIDLTPVTTSIAKRYNLPDKIADWPQEKRQELWDTMSEFTDNDVNGFVRNLVHEKSCTNNQKVLKYELEYMVDVGLYESMKHYFVHKIFEEGDAVDKVKVTGISLKKNETDKVMKNYLKDIYEGVVLHDWTEADYQKYINELYDEFKSKSIDEVAFWKGYGTARESVGFLEMAKGATQISRACTYYNQIIKKLKLEKKYDELRVGDKCRFTYVKKSNKYGIECIAYKPGQWPKEFNDIFAVDYETMFNKIILDQLKRFREACKFEDHDPKKQVVQDVFDL